MKQRKLSDLTKKEIAILLNLQFQADEYAATLMGDYVERIEDEGFDDMPGSVSELVENICEFVIDGERDDQDYEMSDLVLFPAIEKLCPAAFKALKIKAKQFAKETGVE